MSLNSRDAVIVDYARSPMGRSKAAVSDMCAPTTCPLL